MVTLTTTKFADYAHSGNRIGAAGWKMGATRRKTLTALGCRPLRLSIGDKTRFTGCRVAASTYLPEAEYAFSPNSVRLTCYPLKVVGSQLAEAVTDSLRHM